MRIVISLFALLPIIGLSQNSLLWRITSDDSKHISYLFGSMHTNDSLLNTFDQTWWSAFNSCEVFAGEVNSTDTLEMMEAFSAGLMKDTSLSDLYSQEELERIRNFVLSKVDMPTAMVLMRMKPFYIMAAIIQIPEGDGPFDQIMDLRLQRIASEKGKKVIGLETNKEQASSVGAMSLKEQSKMLLEFIDEGQRNGNDLGVLEDLYRAQQLDQMLKFSLEYDTPATPAQMMDALVEVRNARFAERLLPHLKTNNVFCAVGALHLPGKSGLIEQLRSNGYTVEPIAFKFQKE